MNAFSWAVMGFALTGAAYGQVAVPDIADGSIIRDGQISTETVDEAPAPAVDAAASAEVDVNGLNNPSTGPQGSNRTNNGNLFGATFDSNSTNRLIIRDLQANSAASRLGLQAGDRIIGFNGQTYTDVNQFERDLGRLNGNTDMPIIYERNGMRYTKNFRMSSQNDQQTYNGPAYGNQGSNTQSYNSGQESHSAARPIYGMPSNSGYLGGMDPNQGYAGGAAACGNNSYQSQACCVGSVNIEQCCSGHHDGGRHQGGHHHGGRRHRRCCR
ncbi:MAG: PDZ domain-containing protein [Planctomycetaceae bacterium]